MNDRQTPLVSVVMPVYNTARYLSLAVESILHQTFTDFEFIIINDGSTDSSQMILEKYAGKDKRIIIINQTNQGIVAALNRGIGISRGQYIARMDADDISYPRRLECQVEYLKGHPECAALGARVQFIDPDGAILKTYKMPLSHAEIFQELVKGNGGAIIHPVVMFRRESVLTVGGYRKEYNYVEDYDLYTRLIDNGHLANLPDTLLKYRLTPNGINYTKDWQHCQSMKNRLMDQFYLKHNLGVFGREGLPNTTNPVTCSYRKPGSIYLQWSLFASEEGRWPIASKYAFLCLIHEPWERASWKCFSYVLKKRFGFI